MNRQELIDELDRLAAEAKGSGDDRLLAAAGVLYSLCGALHAGMEKRLLNVCADHSQAVVNAITASRN